MAKMILTKGRKYRVTYRGPQHKKDHSFVGVYLGIGEHDDLHAFSLRPKSGTVRMPASYNFTFAQVPDSTPCSEK